MERFRQHVKLFETGMMCDTPVDVQINEYLEKHPEYTVERISYSEKPGTYHKSALVVFGVVLMVFESDVKPI